MRVCHFLVCEATSASFYAVCSEDVDLIYGHIKLWQMVHASEQYKFSCGSFFIISSRDVILTLLSKLVFRQESMYNMRCGATLPHSLSNGYAIKPHRILINKEFADCQKLLSSEQAFFYYTKCYLCLPRSLHSLLKHGL